MTVEPFLTKLLLLKLVLGVTAVGGAMGTGVTGRLRSVFNPLMRRLERLVASDSQRSPRTSLEVN